MNLFSIWPQLGFRENPYDNKGLPGNEVGDRLLVGRDEEVAKIARRVGSSGTHPSVEGLSGVGKTSLLSVAGYRMMQQCLEEAEGTLYIPCGTFFQASESLDAFEAEVYRDIAQTLINNVEAFRQAGLAVPDIGDLDKWLNSPQYRNASGEVAMFGVGYGSEPNSAEGFHESGFPVAIRDELERLFPGPGAGGLVCVLDNLELLQTSGKAREVLEALRDRLFTVPGLRWILCGARGIVSRARSQRLSGIFEAPLTLGPLPIEASEELIRRRIEWFGTEDAYAPVSPESFEFLYTALHQNLRDALAHAQQFSDWIYEAFVAPDDKELPPSDETHTMLEIWLAEEADRAFEEAKGVQRRQWQFFDLLAQRGGSAGASEWKDYGFTTQQQFSGSVTALKNANLVIRETDPEDATRSIATITPQGWLVQFHRSRYALPGSEVST